MFVSYGGDVFALLLGKEKFILKLCYESAAAAAATATAASAGAK
jgi:hypothetical protein